MKVLDERLDYYEHQLEHRSPFSFVRFGNGEWDCLFKRAARTGSGSQSLTSPVLRDGMSLAINYSHPRYFKGIQSKEYLLRLALWSEIEGYLPQSVWHVGDVYHHASARGTLGPTIRSLRKLRVGVIGPEHLRNLDQGVFQYEWFVEVRKKDCFDDYDQIRVDILKQPVVDVYAFSAGPAAKLLIYELYKCLYDRAFLIDFGSVWDPYCGVNSRSYHRKVTPEIIEVNLSEG